jgi:hypothetical protein
MEEERELTGRSLLGWRPATTRKGGLQQGIAGSGSPRMPVAAYREGHHQLSSTPPCRQSCATTSFCRPRSSSLTRSSPTLLAPTGHQEYGCSSGPPSPWPARAATARSASMADEQQATCHISAKLFYVSSPLASNGKNSQPEEQLHGEIILKEMHAFKPWRWRTIRHVKLAANRMVAGSGISQRCQGGCVCQLPMEANSSISRRRPPARHRRLPYCAAASS